MDEIKGRILEYLLSLDNTVADDDATALIVDIVVDRFIAYTNRYQLIEDYEADNLMPSPIPPELERILAQVALDTIKTNADKSESKLQVSSLSDNGQTITYQDKISTYFNSQTDNEIFTGYDKIIQRYRVPTVPFKKYYNRDVFTSGL